MRTARRDPGALTSRWALAGFAAGPIFASSLGAPAVRRAQSGWYRRQKKPAFQPPSWVFGPAWTALYTLMTLSAYRVARTPASASRTSSLRWWWAQMALNAAWTPLFFGRHRRRAALADILLLVPAIGTYIRRARKVDPTAAWMMVPYLGWTAFATALNADTIRLNPPGKRRFLPRPR